MAETQPQPPAEGLAPDAAFWAQEYFAELMQGESSQTDEGVEYLGAPPIQHWEEVEPLQLANAARALATDAEALTGKIGWLTLASVEAQARQQYLCHTQVSRGIAWNRYRHELDMVGQLQAAAQTLLLANTSTLARLLGEASGRRPPPRVNQVRTEKGLIDEAISRLREAEDGHATAYAHGQQEEARRRQGRTQAAGGPLNVSTPTHQRTHDTDVSDGPRRDRFEYHAERHLNYATAPDRYAYEDTGPSWRRVTEYLASCERKFRAADRVSVVLPEHRLTAAQKRHYVLNHMSEITRRRVETALHGQQGRPLVWDPSRTVSALADVWDFDVDSLRPPRVPRTLTEAHNFPELVIAILPRGLSPQDRREELDQYMTSAMDAAFDETPQHVASRVRELAYAIPQGEQQHVGLGALGAWLRLYVASKRPAIDQQVQLLYDDRKSVLQTGDPAGWTDDLAFNVYAEIAERCWQSDRTTRMSQTSADAIRTMNRLTPPRRSLGTAAVAAAPVQPPVPAPRWQGARSRNVPSPSRNVSSPHRDTSEVAVAKHIHVTNADSSDDEDDFVFAVADETTRHGFESLVALVADIPLTAEDLLAVAAPEDPTPASRRLCWRCGKAGHLARNCEVPATDESRQREAFQRARLFRYSRSRRGWRPQREPARFNNDVIINDRPDSPLFVISSELNAYEVG